MCLHYAVYMDSACFIELEEMVTDMQKNSKIKELGEDNRQGTPSVPWWGYGVERNVRHWGTDA